MNTDDELDKIFLNFAVTMEKVIDVDTGRKLAGARGGLLHTLQKRVDQQKKQIKESTLSDIYKPFKPGLWYATRECHLDSVSPRWQRDIFHKGDHILILRCAGWNRGIGSWWWLVDNNVHQAGARGMKDRAGECWYLPSQKGDDASSSEEFLVIVASTCKGKYFVHVVLSTHADGKFEFKSMREWSMLPLETTAYKRVG